MKIVISENNLKRLIKEEVLKEALNKTALMGDILTILKKNGGAAGKSEDELAKIVSSGLAKKYKAKEFLLPEWFYKIKKIIHIILSLGLLTVLSVSTVNGIRRANAYKDKVIHGKTDVNPEDIGYTPNKKQCTFNKNQTENN